MKYCVNCGEQIDSKAEICPHCGVRQPGYSSRTSTITPRIVAALFAILLGSFGIHKFYLGRIGWGIVYILFSWTGIPAIVGVVEGIIYLTYTDEDLISDITPKGNLPRIIYGIWVVISHAILALFLIENSYIIESHLLTLLISIIAGLGVLVLIRKLSLRMLIYTLPLSVLIVSLFFRYSIIPEVIIFTVNRVLFLILSVPFIKKLLPKSRILKIISINTIIIVVSLEIILRIVFSFTHIDILKRKNEIMRLKPGSTFNGAEVNPQGFIGDSPLTDKNSKWLFIGDSFGVGIVDYRYNFINLIGDSLNITDINLSQPGFSPYDYHNVLRDYIDKIRIESVNIVLFTGNDVCEWYIPENGWSYENMRIVNMIRNMALMGLHSTGNKHIIHPEEQLLDIELRRITANNGDNVEIWGRYEKFLEKLTGLHDQREFYHVFIIIPDRYEIDEDMQEAITEELGYRPEFSYARLRTRSFLDSISARYIDTYNELKACGEDVFAENNTHLNIEGNRAVVNAFMKSIDFETIDKK